MKITKTQNPGNLKNADWNKIRIYKIPEERKKISEKTKENKKTTTKTKHCLEKYKRIKKYS